jgi:hypothetical protein
MCQDRTHAPQQNAPLFDASSARSRNDSAIVCPRLGDREIDDEIEFGWLLDRDIAPEQNLSIYIQRRALPHQLLISECRQVRP